MNRRVLVVDDDPNLLAAIRRSLGRQLALAVATSADEALAIMRQSEPFAAMLTDMRMPGRDGIDLLREVKQHWPDTVRMMLTGNADQATAVDAVNTGEVYRFLTKPCQAEAIRQALEAGIRQYQLITAERELLERTLAGSLRLVSDLLDVVDPDHAAFNQRLGRLLKRLAGQSQIPDLWRVQVAATVANLGALTIPAGTVARMRRGDPLSPDEQAAIDGAPAMAGQLIAHIPRLEEVADILTYQHRGFDGSGPPVDDDRQGDAIPLGARVLKLATDLAALLDQGMPVPLALAQLRRHSERYDPDLFELFEIVMVDQVEIPTIDPISVRIPDLQVGQHLIDDIRTQDGRVLVAAGLALTRPLIQRIRNVHRLSGLADPVRVVPALNRLGGVP